jgi:hypothetical protein
MVGGSNPSRGAKSQFWEPELTMVEPSETTALDRLVGDYLASYSARGLSPKTVRLVTAAAGLARLTGRSYAKVCGCSPPVVARTS